MVWHGEALPLSENVGMLELGVGWLRGIVYKNIQLLDYPESGYCLIGG